MRIGIITFHRAINYGAVLQMYALYTYLKQQGHDPFVIDFKQTYPDGYLGRRIISLIKHPFDIFSAVKSRVLVKKGDSYLSQGFESFLKRFITFSGTSQTLEELQNNPPEADIYICGSDQIWNPDEIGFNPAYFLDFGPSDLNRISYGPSFGRNEIPNTYIDDLKINLEKLDAISVREASGVEIVEQLTGREATQVLDPTLLLDDYSEVLDDSVVPPGNYIIAYRLHQER
ncbi:polysaccharide pyruvyl transferase family protein, partial [Candidatus Pacearchaeota archaeon]|nr:polysaccharide pyruvyl transferase family protein [Candidatus Pacearchaeota archaeon]